MVAYEHGSLGFGLASQQNHSLVDLQYELMRQKFGSQIRMSARKDDKTSATLHVP